MEKELAAAAPAALVAMIMITAIMIMIVIAGFGIGAGRASVYLILRTADDETLSHILIVNIIDYGLAQQLSILGAHIDLDSPALKDLIPLFRLTQAQTISRAAAVNPRQKHL